MITRRQLLMAAPTMTAALAIPTRTATALEAPAMTKEARSQLTPDQALLLLKEGNKRFLSGNCLQPNLMAQVKATADGQFPFAGILGCIDSRVPPELVFDQGIGDIFSARIAGNFVNADFIGSFEFATKLAGAKLIVVLGHTDCGAIKGATDKAQLGNLTQTLSNLMPAVYAVTNVKGERNSSNNAFVTSVAEENVRLNVKALYTRSTILHELVNAEKIKIVGAMHDVNTGEVSFLT